ncbi:Ankyrin repeat, PH and SEC7 domain containing protein secG [Toxocara canis]|uniref:Ankyrin repeat, PH and SEC7 domain containing protein secG n=1 Tax=Toxocara canis TaxID=6265 RepID=A0A0B2V5W8_TOXCA|nr:Ankyrin repeat, PH and SEC7 domain containing protein secG [Toxocara canis]
MSGLSLIRALDGSDMNETARILEISPEEVSSRDGEDRVALHYAAETADAETFKRILELDPSLIDCQDHNGYTPLLIAAMSGNTSAAEILLERGAQINHIDKDKHSPVHWAVVCGQFDTLALLLRKGANVNASDNQGAQPLHYATISEDIPQERNEAILHILLKNGASVNGKDIDERTPILWAASNGNTEAMMSLIQAGGDRYAIDRDQLNALHCAASHGHEHMLELLIESCDKSIIDATDRNGDTPLFYAVTLGHFECARLLLLSGANANHQVSCTRLCFAIIWL